MSTQIDWRGELDAAVAAAPDRPVEPYVRAGRRAVRRRRAAGVAIIAVMAVAGGAAWAVTPGSATRSDSPVATQGSPSPTAVDPSPADEQGVAPLATRPEDVRAAGPEHAELFDGASMPVSALADGELVREPDWRVEAIYVLQEKGERKRVWGISAVPAARGEATWMLITWRPGSVGALSDPEGKRFAVFEDWLDATWGEQQGEDPPEIARTVGGELKVAAGVEVLETVTHPRQAAAYGPVDQQWAARLRLGDGTVVFARIDAEGTTTVDPAVLDAPTMDAFLAHLAQQADSGEGLR
jgi:hypothetical protein